MDEHFDYRNKFSGKSITEVGISAAIQLQNSAAASGYAGKFGLGMIQWTGSRTGKLFEIPGDTANQARIRAQNASKIYNVMTK